MIRAYGEVTAAQTVLTPDNAVVELTRALDIAMTERRPVYIGIPSDVPMLDLPCRPPRPRWPRFAASPPRPASWPLSPPPLANWRPKRAGR
ncbi:hypothetical protein [Fodinicola feengrottensis]|uniref:hypothetical protein n=1 Tax=Fodinicola feengrottensis TaxID=435914 RepID=UPI0013D7C5C5|nr:hypothetical protein [Fodinicola feengrottensis]